MSLISNEELLQALDRIARTRDGELLYLYFQRIEMEIAAGPEPSDCALRTNHGRRSLAAELMGRMAKGIDDSGGRSNQPDGAQRTERPVVFLTRQPVRVSPRESAREHIARTDPELAHLRVNQPGDAGTG